VTRRKDDEIIPELPVRVEITITGAQLDDVTIGLMDIAAHLTGGYTSGEVRARRGQYDGYEWKVTQL
jgi:hypothetical protein